MRRLSGLDAGFLSLETPNSHMHVASLYVYDPATVDGGYSFERVKQLVANRLHLLAPFRWRLVEVPFGLHHPIWIEDPDFDLDNHIRPVTLPAPGDDQALAELAGEFMSRRLDRSRPLWEMWFVDGLAGGKVAILSKTHHAAIDGVSGAELTANLLDVSPETVIHPPPDPPWAPDPVPTEAEMLAYAINSIIRQPAKLADTLRRAVGSAVSGHDGSSGSDAVASAGLFRAPRTSFNGPISGDRVFAFTSVALEEIKRVRAAHGGTVNDVVLALCAGALRRYLLDREELPSDPLVAMVPISVRTEDQKSTMGNRVSNMFVAMHTNVGDPVERFRRIRHASAEAKTRATASAAPTIADWAEFAAPAIAASAARLYASLRLAERVRPLFNLTISNVPGPSIPLYSAGARMIAWYPMGPIFDGIGLNITVMSYMGVMHFGLVADRESVPNASQIANYVADALRELLAAANGDSAPAKPPARKAPTKQRTIPTDV